MAEQKRFFTTRANFLLRTHGVKVEDASDTDRIPSVTLEKDDADMITDTLRASRNAQLSLKSEYVEQGRFD
ncbi:hypothetical protein, partial [Escherichia coli]|uniref:hypothetical protein n=1 Tax=Escherichia coli TaxID=562 RepID=UPI00398AF448